MITSTAFAGKHYAVLGLARSGRATVDALLASGAKVTAWDDREEARTALSSGEGQSGGQDSGLRRRTAVADFVQSDLTQFDSIVVTPGLPLNRHPIAARAKAAGVEIIGDIELFARARAELPPHKVVGITGTNGKSTTTALVHHILRTAGVPSLMGGNIGLPILAQDPLPEGGVYVLELSSYQLDLTQSLNCDIAVLLNITPDHLDRYKDFKAYRASKLRLFEMQRPSEPLHAAVVGEPAHPDKRPDDQLINLIPNTTMLLALDYADRQSHWPALQGPHNHQNAACAIAVTEVLGLDEAVVEHALRTYPGLPHRMERVAERDSILFVNDSKATNATATAPALAAFPAIRWILGGQAKSDNLDECTPHFSHVRKAYTIGEASGLFAALLKPHMAVAECGTLGAAVKAAAADAQPGETVLLSPACASFDQFADFEARGEAFRAAVEAL